MTTPTTRASEGNLADLRRIQRESAWLETHLPDLHALSWSQRHQPAEQIHSRSHVTSGPDLSQRMDSQLRDRLTVVTRRLKHMANEITALRVSLEPFLEDQDFDSLLTGTEVEKDELARLRKAKERRDAMAGDPRWGEWEARPEKQPHASFRGEG